MGLGVLALGRLQQEGGSGVSGGEKRAVVCAPSCGEVNQEGKKSKREGKLNKEV